MSRRLGVDELTATLLLHRNQTAESAPDYLLPKLRTAMPDPSSLTDMDAAANAIVDAVMAKRSVTVFADYDVDGGTSAAQLIRWARHYGVGFDLYVPDRILEGYGPSADAFREIKRRGADLVVTVDCGAAATAALDVAAEIGLPVIVVDHHQMGPDIPPSLALVNPNRDDDVSDQGHLAAAGVTFLLLVALNRVALEKGLGKGPDLMTLTGLAALGTVCDVVPLTGFNRAIVAQGMKALSARPPAGVEALCEVASARAPLTAYHAGFVFGPRINAGGRIGVADMGARLLATDDIQTAMSLARELDDVNARRRAMQDDILREATEHALAIPENAPLIFAATERWHPGVIGIVAGRLKDRFRKPAIVIGITDDGLAKGSGRSVKGVDLGGAIAAAKTEGLVSSGGGHAMAGGLTTTRENLGALQAFLKAHIAASYAEATARLGLDIDVMVTPGAVNLELVERLEAFAPFGAGNRRPVLAFRDVEIAYAQRTRGDHVRATFRDARGHSVKAIVFRASEKGLDDLLLRPGGARVHVAGTIKRDSWKGQDRVDFNVIDVMEA